MSCKTWFFLLREQGEQWLKSFKGPSAVISQHRCLFRICRFAALMAKQ